jgi:hypothetical protein
MLFVRRPHVLSGDEAARWMREQATPLASLGAVERIEMTRLEPPALRGTEWHWLIEMHCETGEDAGRAARHETCRELIADLRLLGMQPRLVVADGTESFGR